MIARRRGGGLRRDQGAPAYREPIARRQHRPAREDVAVDGVDALEDAQAAADDGRQLEPQTPRQRARQRASGFEQAAGARDFEGEQRAPGGVGLALGNLRFGHAEALQIVLGQVDAVLLPVDADVLPEVDQLQARADRVRLLQVQRRRRAVEM